MLGYPYDLFDIEKTMQIEKYFGLNYNEMPVFVCGSFTSEGDQNFLDLNGIKEHGIPGRGAYEPSVDKTYVSGISSAYDTPNPVDRIYVIKNKYY
jgi:hypothetical protein